MELSSTQNLFLGFIKIAFNYIFKEKVKQGSNTKLQLKILVFYMRDFYLNNMRRNYSSNFESFYININILITTNFFNI